MFFFEKKTWGLFFWSLPSKGPSDQRNQVAETSGEPRMPRIEDLGALEWIGLLCLQGRTPLVSGFRLGDDACFFPGGEHFFFGGGLVKAGYKKRHHLGSMDLSESCKFAKISWFFHSISSYIITIFYLFFNCGKLINICQDWLVHAATIQCSHTFCWSCIDRWLQTKQFLCPVCRKEARWDSSCIRQENPAKKLML